MGVAARGNRRIQLRKVLYWMLSGGEIFGREDHRARPLTEILGEQRFEHVDTFLDKVVVENPANRVPFSDLIALVKEMEALAKGNFAPLKPSIGIVCRFCGIGKYERFTGGSAGNIGKVGIAPMAQRDLPAAVVCARLLNSSTSHVASRSRRLVKHI
jgi:hypothetical protein